MESISRSTTPTAGTRSLPARRERVLDAAKKTLRPQRGLRHRGHDCSNGQGEDRRALQQRYYCRLQRLPCVSMQRKLVSAFTWNFARLLAGSMSSTSANICTPMSCCRRLERVPRVFEHMMEEPTAPAPSAMKEGCSNRQHHPRGRRQSCPCVATFRRQRRLWAFARACPCCARMARSNIVALAHLTDVTDVDEHSNQISCSLVIVNVTLALRFSIL